MDENMEPEDGSHEPLDRLLRAIPGRRAPPALERRVLAELGRRAALPWWRRRFAHWPMMPRVAFVLACAAVVALSILGLPDLAQSRAGAAALALTASWTHPAGAVLVSAADLMSVFSRLIPRVWAHGLVAAAAVLYALLFGLGATAYWSLYRQAPELRQLP
jgi:hypothetical protein